MKIRFHNYFLSINSYLEYSIILILYYSIEQMVGCKSRGYLFTRAHLGLCSDELHVCGDPAVVPLIQRILEDTGDVVTVI